MADAVRNVYEDKISVVAEYDQMVRSPSIAMRLPSVVALREYRPMPTRVAFTRFNVFLRDRFRCQYCGGAFTAKELTFEHVVPRSLGGKMAWDNIVAACEPCNVGKDKQAADEAQADAGGADAARAARREALLPAELPARELGDFLYWDIELES